MRNWILACAVLAAMGFIFVDISFGHGGQYRGPNDTVPPNLGGPGDAAPPSNPGGPAAPGPAGPSSGPKGPAIASGPGTVGGPRVASTGGLGRKRTAGGEGFEQWQFWWESNKDRYLNLKDRLSQTGNVSGSSGFLTGRGRKEAAASSKRPTPEIINQEIVPALKRAMKEDHPDILDSTVLALARITRPEYASLVLDDIMKLVGSKHQTAMEAASLSLGVLGAADPAADIYELMIDSARGQQLVGKHEVPAMVRGFAALSYGLINPPGGADRLMTIIKRAPDKDKDLKGCAITALGLMKENEAREKIVNYLIKLMDDSKMDPLIQASVPTALGKIGDSVALSRLVKGFKDDKVDDRVRMSCTLALGILASIEDKEVIDLLKAYIGKGKDAQTRHFCYIAMAQIAARDEEPEKNMETHQEISKFFLRDIVKGKQTHKPWAGLAAALHAQKIEIFQADVIDKVTEVFKKDKNPSYRSAMAVALGLLSAKRSADILFDELERSKDKAFKGYLCVSLGLMNHKAAAERIRKIAATEVTNFRLRLQAATALGLMGDVDAVDVLIKALKEGQTVTVTSSAAQALGLIGDISAIAPLRKILEDRKANDLARAFAAVALGIIGEKTDLPWYTIITANYNYRAKVAAISEVYDLL
ncbi:MAG: HEAT repeat domain-containing protein [Planctomycetota bacterium]